MTVECTSAALELGSMRLHGFLRVQGSPAALIARATKHLVGVQARVAALHVIGLERLDGGDDVRRDELDGVINARNGLERVEHRRRSRAKQLRRAARDQLTIRQFDGDGRLAVRSATAMAAGTTARRSRLDIQACASAARSYPLRSARSVPDGRGRPAWK